MEDLEKQFFAENDSMEQQFFAEPETQKSQRGVNIGGAVRNVARATPFFGDWMDEIEAGIRYPFSSYDYETLRKNAEESGLGNIENTSYGQPLHIGTNIAENALAAYLTGGLTLLPPVSAAQGAIEGFGRGSDLGERTSNALTDAAISYVVPKILNKALPTKEIQKIALNRMPKISDGMIGKAIDKVAKWASSKKSPAEEIISKALQQGITPEDVIAREVPRGMRPDLWSKLRRDFTGENVYRKTMLNQASKTVSSPYDEYITKEVEKVAPQYAKKLGDEIEKLKLDELGEDIVGEIDPRKLVNNAVNKVMKGAKQEERELVASTMSEAIAKRGVAKKITTNAVERPIAPSSGSFWNILRRLSSPVRNVSNYGTMRTMTVGTPNYVPSNSLEKMLNFYTPTAIRGGLDSAIEDYEMSTIK